MKDFFGVTGELGDALFGKIYRLFGFRDCWVLGEVADH